MFDGQLPTLLIWTLPLFFVLAFPCLLRLRLALHREVRNDGIQSTFKQVDEPENKRHNQRVPVEDVPVFLQDDHVTCRGTMCNISYNGICLGEIPTSLFQEAKNLTIWFEEAGQRIALQVKPKWETTGTTKKKIGAKIMSPPAGWFDFCTQMMECSPRAMAA
jgi:hypothetical protein